MGRDQLLECETMEQPPLPVIKYENCEEIYTGPGAATEQGSTTAMSASAYGAAAHKRNYGEIGGAGGGGDGYLDMSAGITPQMQEHYRNFYTASQQQHQHNALSGRMPEMLVAAAPVKRFRRARAENGVLFSEPFFELEQEYDAVNACGTLTARCRQCHVVLRGHKNVSSNFIKHMKRLHPETYKIYENLKLLKYRGTAHEANLLMAASNSSSTEGDSAYFDPGAFLDHIATTHAAVSAAIVENGPNSETTENSVTPPNSADAVETGNSTPESQQQQQQPNQHQQHQPSVRLVPDERMRKEAVAAAAVVETHTKVDLSQKTLDMMGHMLDEKLKAFVTKTELHDTTQRLANSVAQQNKAQRQVSVNGSSDSDTDQRDNKQNAATTNAAGGSNDNEVHAQLQALKQECDGLRLAIEQSQQSKRQLQRELSDMDRQLRRNKLVMRSVQLDDQEQPQAAAQRLLHKRLELPDIELGKVTVLPQNKTPNKKHNLLVELRDAGDAQRIFRNCFKLKNTGIFIEPSMSHYARKRKEKLLVLRKELLRRNAALKVNVRQTNLVVSGKHFFHWDAVEGLCVGNALGAETSATTTTANQQPNAAAHLNSITGLDLKEFLNVLKNYDVQMR